MIRVSGTVRCVQVDSDVRVVRRHHRNERTSLWGIELHMIPVEVEALSVGTLPHATKRTVLPRAIAQVHPLVSISVVDRSDEQNQVLSPRRIVSSGEIPEEHQQGFFPTDLARVDVALEINPSLARRPHRFG